MIFTALCPRKIIFTNFRVHLPQIVHDAVQVQFARPQYDVFTGLLYLSTEQPIKSYTVCKFQNTRTLYQTFHGFNTTKYVQSIKC